MEIRKAKLKEVNEIAILLKQVADIHNKGRPDIFKEKSIEDIIENTKNCIKEQERKILVVEDKEQIIGVAMYKFNNVTDHPYKFNKKILSIEQIVVEEKQRSKGIGKLLLDKIKDIAKEEKCDSIELNCWSFNKRAMEFYKEYGMEEQRCFFELKV